MKRLLWELQKALSYGGSGVLVTIVSRSGSTPRGAGAAMVILPNGEQVGTIGGGSLEYRARTQAGEFANGAPDGTVSYEIHANRYGKPKISDGTVTVLFRRFQGEQAGKLVAEALTAIEKDTGAYFVCPIENGTAGETRLLSPEGLVERFHFEHEPEGTVFLEGNPSWFVEPLVNDPRILLFGAGHVAQKTAILCSFLGDRVWVIDDRKEYANPERFPTAERILCAPLQEAKAVLAVHARDHAIVMTSAHERDYAILRWLLSTPADYIGCLGSRQKIAAIKEKLLFDGVRLEQFSRIHAPIGLDIGAETPEEIAVSIAAELVAYRKKHGV
ncbi:MAG: XdhC family protein [Eubacteriales bacterium]|nr:XdhC family protein [Eubacteriales bacterium]